MDTIFINSKNSKSSDPYSLLLNLAGKINLKISDKKKRSPIICYTWKISKNLIRTTNLKYQLQHGIKNLSYLMHHIPYQILEIILSIS